ncbi:hypothetical protein JSY36_07925 [Bacillus sp. H-16]|uniref:hypothetical protein n=1 Tax=Alteribacter salitolerans TaxID=2912333 RepID=UPI001965FC3F|nr:hypothetical protein [Alteribacter salitolerans]MBM7095679.1 hypothetical protein [Alteribacter salitolerans]
MKIKVNDIIHYLLKEKLQHSFIGDLDIEIEYFSSINNVKDHCVSWVKDIKAFDISDLENTKNILIVCNDFNEKVYYKNLSFICCENPKEAFYTILKYFFPKKENVNFISPKATVESESLGKDIYIGHNTYVGEEVEIGNHVIIKNNVSLEGRIKIGDYSIINSGVVIGSDGFGYYQNSEGIQQKVPHYGGVNIGKHVEIGANTCIDRGTLDNTDISDYVKINNLCHIAHNVQIKKHVFITSGTIIAGSTTIGESSYIAPGTVIRNQLKIGQKSFIGMGSVVVKDVNENEKVLGVPANIMKK